MERELAKGAITAADHAAAVDRLRKRYIETGSAMSKMEMEAEKLGREMRAMNDMFRNFNQGDIVQARSNLINFSQQVITTGQVTSAFAAQGPELIGLFTKLPVPVQAAGGAFLAFAGAGAAVAARIASIEAEARKLDTTLRALNPQLRGVDGRGVAFQVAEQAGIGRGDAFATVSTIARTRGIRDAETVRDLAKIAADVGAVLGEDAERAGGRLAAAFAKGAAGIRELDAELAFLSPEMARLVRDLDAAGDRAGAMGIAMDGLRDRFGGAVKDMRSGWGEAVHQMTRAFDGFLEHVARSDIAQHLARGFANMGRSAADAMAPESEASRIVATNRAMVEAEREVTRLRGMENRTPIVNDRLREAEARVERLRTEVDRLVEEARRAAAAADQGPAADVGGMSASEVKRLDALRDAYQRETEALTGTSAERAVRVAGLAAEQAALEAGRSAAAAHEERLIRESAVRRDLSLSVRDQIEAQKEELRVARDLAALRSVGGTRAEEALVQAEAERRRTLAAGGTPTQAREARDNALQLDAADRRPVPRRLAAKFNRIIKEAIR